MRIEVVHGPNLNLLGTREPEIYGAETLDAVDGRIRDLARELGVDVGVVQSNHEGELVDRIQQVAGSTDGYLVNAGGYTHTSVALRDALVAAGRPFVEVHLSNVHGREAFRRRSLLAPVALGIVAGFGAESYTLALRGLVRHLQDSNQG